MENIRDLVKKYIKKESDTLYRISIEEEEEKALKTDIIIKKAELSKKRINFTLDDFALVRITGNKNVPRNFTYYELDKRNTLYKIEDPFYLILGWLYYDMEPYDNKDVGIPHSEIDYNKYSLLSPRNRSTKHFAMNSLASNIHQMFMRTIAFDVGDFIIIEPLKERITDPRLVVLNPVDTFFNLHESKMPIGNNAIFLIQENSLSKYLNDPLMKERLQKHRIYIFKGHPSIAVEIALLDQNIMPQETKEQSEIKPSYIKKNGESFSDEHYIKQYQDYIEYLNQFYLHTSYYNLPEEVIKNRQKNASYLAKKPGILHSETEIAKMDNEKNLENDMHTYQEYIEHMFRVANMLDQPIDEIIRLIKVNVLRMDYVFERNFTELYDEYESTLFKVVKTLGYPRFKQETDNFNKNKEKSLNPLRQG